MSGASGLRFRSEPYWYDRFPPRRRPSFPRHRASLETRVIVIGGGLTGCACAVALAAARVPVVVVEADRIGGGATGGSPGLIREDFDGSFRETAERYGVRAARTLWEGLRRASLEFPAALRRFGINCELVPQDLLNLAPARSDIVRLLRRDYDARRAAGFDHRWITPLNLRREAALESNGAIKTRGSVFDPYRACVGLASAAVKRGALLFERTDVARIKSGRKVVEVVTKDGTIRGETVIVASGVGAIADLRPLRRHLHPRHGYGVVTGSLPAAIRRQLGARNASLREASSPPRFVRWLKDDRILVAGADQDPVPARSRDAAIIQRTGQLMYELSLLYPAVSGIPAESGWSLTFDDTVDGLPYVGPHRNFPRMLFALGLGRHGSGAAWLAARILLRHVTDAPLKGDDLFSFSRILQHR
jgi:glycine/D-amino acid oxidase-like deaminating enzyme